MKVLAVRFSAIGDCVMAAWAVSAIRRDYPESQVVWALQDTCLDVVDVESLVHERFVADRLSWRSARWHPSVWRAQLRLFAGLRRRRFDVGFDFQGHLKTALCLRLAAPRRRVSHLATDQFASTLNTQVQVDRATTHEVEAHHRLVETLLPLSGKWSVQMPQAKGPESADAVTIQTGASRVEKRYPIELWREVAQRLVQAGLRVVAVGGPHDPTLDVPGVTNLVGKLSLAQTMGVLRQSRLHLSGDTGTGHIAAAYGVPVVSLFGRSDPRRFRPFGAPVTVLSADRMADIVPAEVAAAALDYTRKACVS
jgi:ADP-heptose:LPS heptosyltransferase